MTDIERLENEIAELQRKRAGTISAAAAVLEGEASALDNQILQANARVEQARQVEAAERERANSAALHDAVARFCNHAALLEDALANVVSSPDREWAVLEALKAVRSLEVAFRPRQSHSRTYAFADPAHTIVRRNDGQSFVWPAGASISDVNGRVAEQYRLDGSPLKR